jgi:uncharacterized cupredoxin-like copper-binding protein
MLGLALACAPAKRATPPNANVVKITATDYAFGAPDTIPSGLTEVRMENRGREPHQAVVVGAQQKTFAEMEAALMKEGPIPEWLSFPGGAGVVGGGDSSIVTVNLTPGNYLLVCLIPSPDGTPHVAKGMVRRLVVTAAPAGAAAAAEPASDITVTLSDYAFALSTPITAGTHTIRIENSGPQLHELTVERLLPGKTLADWQKWAAGGQRGTPPTEAVGGFAGPDKGTVGWVTLTFRPGNYLFTCYVPDAKDGKPHIAHGMVQQITVS